MISKKDKVAFGNNKLFFWNLHKIDNDWQDISVLYWAKAISTKKKKTYFRDYINQSTFPKIKNKTL